MPTSLGPFDPQLNPSAWFAEEVAPIGIYDGDLVLDSSGPVARAMSATGSVGGAPTSASLATEAISASGAVSGSLAESDNVQLGISGTGTVSGSLTSAVLAAESPTATGVASGSLTPVDTTPAPSGAPVVTSSGGGGGIHRIIDDDYIRRLLAERRAVDEARRPRLRPQAPTVPAPDPIYVCAGMRALGVAAGAAAIAVLVTADMRGLGIGNMEAHGSSRASGVATATGRTGGEMEPAEGRSAVAMRAEESARATSTAAIARLRLRSATMRLDHERELAARDRGAAAAMAACAHGHHLEVVAARARTDASEKTAAHRAAVRATVAQVRLARHLGHAQRRTRIPRAMYPKVIELEYGKSMIGLVAVAHSAITPLLRELPALVAANARADSARLDVGETSRARQLIDHARHHLEAAIRTSDVEALARKFADRTQLHQRGELAKQVRAALGADVLASDRKLPSLIDGFVHENAVLIKSVPGDVIAGIEQLTTRALAAGTPHAALAEQIQERFDIGERRSRTIARDQVGKLYGRIAAYRHQDLGVRSFIWRTMGDEKVRPEHDELDGDEFEYDELPSEGLPGEAVLCRCGQEPVFDAILAALDDNEE